jgi:hypothetical protein
MTVIGRQLAIQPKFRGAKIGRLCVGTKFVKKEFARVLNRFITKK